MNKLRRNKYLSLAILVFFVVFMFDSVAFAKSANYPKYVKIPFKVEGVKVKIKRVKGKIVPLEMRIGNKTFPVVKQQGTYGIKMKTQDMVALSPEFKDSLGTSLSQLAVYRVQQLVDGDRTKAKDVVDRYQQTKKRSSVERGVKNMLARAFLGIASTFKVPAAVAAEREGDVQGNILVASAGTGVDLQFLNQMNQAYGSVLQSQSFFYPMVPSSGPFIPWDWDVASEGDDTAATSDDDDSESWYDVLLGLLLIAVVLIAPVAAVLWLCAAPLTIASILAAFTASVGAVTGAGIVATTLGSILDLLHGKPLWEWVDYTTYSSDTGYFTEIGPAHGSWP